MSSMEPTALAELCRVLDLGRAVLWATPVSGGLLHRMWRITTTRGTYAVKELNPEIMRRPGIRETFRLSERIASMAAAAGLPAVAALQDKGGPLQEIGQATMLVYPWVEGETLPPTPAEPARAHQIGVILGRLHRLDLRLPQLEVPRWTAFADEHWADLVTCALDRGLPWAGEATTALPDLQAWSGTYRQASERLGKSLVVSHRDLDQKNVLWRDAHTPLLIDWEAAGWTNPTLELASVALYWSGQAVGYPSRAVFEAVVEGYRSAGLAVRGDCIDALWGCAGGELEWLELNMRRSIGEPAFADEQGIGWRETVRALGALRSLAANLDTWGRWMDEAASSPEPLS